MQNLVNRLREKKLEVSEAREQIVKIREELEKTELGQSLVQAIEYNSVVGEELKAIEDHLRKAVLEYYRDTDDKNPVDGVSVIINKSLVYDIDWAIAWAINFAVDMLKLDKKLFEKHAKSVADTMPLDFVTIEDEPAVRIAKKL